MSSTNGTSRRNFLLSSASAAAGLTMPGVSGEAFAATPGWAKEKASAANEKIWSSEYWAQKGDVKLVHVPEARRRASGGKVRFACVVPRAWFVDFVYVIRLNRAGARRVFAYGRVREVRL